ncbi:MAG TPA: hypothetical protein VD994_19620 [Prosthecobacter sp.]|nr:hypothetical protein [Prosthecobacter sp.]
MKVEIRTYREDHENGKLLRTWALDKMGRAVCSSPSSQEGAELHGIIGEGGRRYYPKDGEAFLRNLPLEYSGSSFVSAVIIE